MTRRRTWPAAAVPIVALAALGVGTALAIAESTPITEHAEVEGDDTSSADAAEDTAEGEDRPISDQVALARASQAALAWLEAQQGVTGTVSETEVGDEESNYEIEITLEGGRQVDVQLTKDFRVIGLD
jgi:hypothetical protein